MKGGIQAYVVTYSLPGLHPQEKTDLVFAEQRNESRVEALVRKSLGPKGPAAEIESIIYIEPSEKVIRIDTIQRDYLMPRGLGASLFQNGQHGNHKHMGIDDADFI